MGGSNYQEKGVIIRYPLSAPLAAELTCQNQGEHRSYEEHDTSTEPTQMTIFSRLPHPLVNLWRLKNSQMVQTVNNDQVRVVKRVQIKGPYIHWPSWLGQSLSPPYILNYNNNNNLVRYLSTGHRKIFFNIWFPGDEWTISQLVPIVGMAN